MLEGFQQYLKQNGYHPRTIDLYLNYLEIFISWVEKETQEKFSKDLLSDAIAHKYYLHLLTSKASQTIKRNTLNVRLSALTTFFRFLGFNYSFPKSAFTLKDIEVPQTLSEQEQERLLQVLDQDIQDKGKNIIVRRDAYLVKFILYTGLRAHEVFKLKIGDVKWAPDGKELCIHNTRRNARQQMRRLPLSPQAQEVLDGWLSIRPNTTSDLLWVSSRREKLSPRTMIRSVKRYALCLNLPHLSVTTLRMTFAQSMLQKGIKTRELDGWLGFTFLYSLRKLEEIRQKNESEV